jgi:hypothetical protein
MPKTLGRPASTTLRLRETVIILRKNISANIFAIGVVEMAWSRVFGMARYDVLGFGR